MKVPLYPGRAAPQNSAAARPAARLKRRTGAAGGGQLREAGVQKRGGSPFLHPLARRDGSRILYRLHGGRRFSHSAASRPYQPG